MTRRRVPRPPRQHLPVTAACVCRTPFSASSARRTAHEPLPPFRRRSFPEASRSIVPSPGGSRAPSRVGAYVLQSHVTSLPPVLSAPPPLRGGGGSFAAMARSPPRSGREVLLLSVGFPANAVATHVVNVWSSEAVAGASGLAQTPVRSGATGEVRINMWDLAGATRGRQAVRQDEMVAEDDVGSLYWHAGVDVHGEGARAPTSEFAQMAEQLDDDQQPSEALADAAEALDAPDEVKSWADFLHVPLPPKALHVIPGVWHDNASVGLANPVDALNTWTTTRGYDGDTLAESANDAVRRELERCEHAQGTAVLFADDTPWIAPTARILEELRDTTEGKHTIVACGASDANSTHELPRGLCASQFLGQALDSALCDAYLPLGIDDPTASMFEASAWQAVALEAVLTPMRTVDVGHRENRPYEAFGMRPGCVLDEVFRPLTESCGHFALHAALDVPTDSTHTLDALAPFVSPITQGARTAADAAVDVGASAEMYLGRGWDDASTERASSAAMARLDEQILARQRAHGSLRCAAGRFWHDAGIAVPMAFPARVSPLRTRPGHPASVACLARLRATRSTPLYGCARDALRTHRRVVRGWGVPAGDEEPWMEALADAHGRCADPDDEDGL